MSSRSRNRLNRTGENRVEPRAGQERIGAARHNSFFGGDGAGHMERDDDNEIRAFQQLWVHLPTEITIEGLDEAAIMGWWYSFVRGESTDGNNRGGYRMISKTRNCASMVMRALIAGGANKVSHVPLALTAYDPVTVKNYAQFLSTAKRKVRISDEEDTIPNSVNWQKFSNSSLPFASRMLVKVNANAISRNEEMRDLDLSIKNWPSALNNSRKTFAIMSMYEQMGNYLRTKPHGDRTMAVVTLAKRIYLYTKKEENHQLWNLVTRDLYNTDGNADLAGNRAAMRPSDDK